MSCEIRPGSDALLHTSRIAFNELSSHTCHTVYTPRNYSNCSVIELNRTQSNDWVRLGSEIEHNRTKKVVRVRLRLISEPNRSYSNVVNHHSN